MSDYGCPLAYLQNMVDADALPVEVLNAIKEQTNKTKVVAGYSLSALWKMNKKQSIPMLFSALEEVVDLQREIKKLKDYKRIAEKFEKERQGQFARMYKLEEENKKLKCEDDKQEDTLASLNFYTEQCAELKEEIKKLKEINESFTSDTAAADAAKDEVIKLLVGDRVKDQEKTIKKLEEEIKELKDFSNWENHPALKHKVVLDDDYYLEHEQDGDLIDPDDFKKLQEENYKLTCRINSLHKIHEEFKQILTQE
jgi:hypothetical protein